MAGCQNNMRQLGTALIDYSQASGGYFPVIPPSGNLSFAGVYAPKLVAKGLVQDGQLLHCPAKESTLVFKIPPLQDIAAAQGPHLVTLHRTMGGDYAYTLGFVRRGHLNGVRNQGHWNVAILADVPLENLRNRSIGTHGPGQNVLFADGHVRFLAKRRRPGTRDDDMFFNARGDILAGVNADDTVLAPSYVSPLPTVGNDPAARALVQ
jgi:prepilin-type processing-associated H-X9-DG protein